MNAGLEHPQAFDPVSNAFDQLIEWLMAALLAFMPFAFGAVSPWAEEVVVIVAGAMIACLILKIAIRPGTELVWTWAYVPLGLLLLVGMLQLVDLPIGVARAVSPNTVAIKTRLLGSLSGGAPSDGGMTLSFYGLATARALRLALAVSAVFVVTVNVYRRADQIRRLLAVVVVIGACVAALALAQTITGTEKIYWQVPARAMAGPFVNRNNYCQFMNLSVAAAIGLLLFRLKTAFRGEPLSFSRVIERIGDRSLRPAWYLSGVIVLAVSSIFLSLSRGGMISMLVAWGVTMTVLSISNRLRPWGWMMCFLAAGALACVLYIGFDAVYDRVASLGRLQEYGGRWQLVRDSIRSWATFPLFGTGLGTHEYVYPMFDNSTILATATHVENEYVQMAEETGIVGLFCVGAFGVIILINHVRCLRREQAGLDVVAVGLGAGLLAVLVHSAADFGLHLLANACLAATFCGLLVAIARAGKQPAEHSADPHPQRRWRVVRALAIGWVIAIVAVWGWAATGADAARRAETSWRKAQLLEKSICQEGWAVDNSDWERLIALTGEAVEHEPRNVLYRYWLNAHRWRSVSRVADPVTGNVYLDSMAMRSASRIVTDLEEASLLCPTFGPNYSLAGQVKFFVLGDPSGADLIRTGGLLAPCDPAVCFANGMLDAYLKEFDASLAMFRRALALDGDWFRRIVKVYVFQAGRPDLAIEIAKTDVWRLLAVAELLEQQGNGTLATEARDKAEALLRVQCRTSEATAWMLARAGEMCLRRQQYEQAAAYYRRALFRECGNVMWRLRYAESLAATGKVSQARQQAAICLKLQPGMSGALALMASLRSYAASNYDVN